MITKLRILAFSLFAGIVVPLILGVNSTFCQVRDPRPRLKQVSDSYLMQRTPSCQRMATNDSIPSFYKRKKEWQKIIDDYWGPGDPYLQKLAAFDTYVSYVRQIFPAFIYSRLNWDSVAGYWRAKVTDSTSRGGFNVILGRLAQSLNEWHAGAFDNAVYAPELNPGTPGVWFVDHDVRHFGAALTPLPDSSLLVYKVVANHPLGLQRGDRVLGYEGIAWPQIFNELTAAGIGTDWLVGGCPTAREYYRLAFAGMFWHLFDTIDVVKFGTGNTLHLPTAPLASLDVSAPLLHCDQLPIAGVPMPSEDLLAGDVTYGIVQGTNIGYIYVRHHMDPKISGQFDGAVQALASTDGLLIDLRLDYGGRYGLERGISRLVNFADSTLQFRRRTSTTDLNSMGPADVLDVAIPGHFGKAYAAPIAVLLGPQCRSWGDVSAWQLSYVPGIRFFGKSTTGAYSGYWWGVAGPTFPGYTFWCPNFIEVDHRFPEIQLLNREFPVDENVWLTPDDVAKGDDTVVKKALAWIITDVSEGKSQPPATYALAQNYPNPFNPSTIIKYELLTSSMVRLSVYDVLGREVAVLMNEKKGPGSFEVKFDAAGLASGVYLYQLTAGNFIQTRKMILVR